MQLIVRFDHLVISTGLQYDPREVAPHFEEWENVFGVERALGSKIKDAIEHVVQAQFWPNAAATIAAVYGSDLQAWATLQGLLSAGVTASKIVWIRPPMAKHIVSAFENQAIDDKMTTILKDLGVVIEQGIVTGGERDEGAIIGVDVQVSIAPAVYSNQKAVDGTTKSIPCQLLLYCHVKSVNPTIFKAINDAYLVFDKRLVIDHQFRTHDPAMCGFWE
jgi:hypothetical protein